MFYNFGMDKRVSTEKRIYIPEGSQGKLFFLRLRYAGLTMGVYLLCWTALYLLTAVVDLAVVIPPMYLIAIYLIIMVLSIAMTIVVMRSKGMAEYVKKWL